MSLSSFVLSEPALDVCLVSRLAAEGGTGGEVAARLAVTGVFIV
jgi:hypothetical protein